MSDIDRLVIRSDVRAIHREVDRVFRRMNVWIVVLYAATAVLVVSIALHRHWLAVGAVVPGVVAWSECARLDRRAGDLLVEAKRLLWTLGERP